MNVSTNMKKHDCQHLWQCTFTCLLLSRFYHQPKTHSERRERGKVQREVFKVIMIAPFITLSESRLREKSFSRNVVLI